MIPAANVELKDAADRLRASVLVVDDERVNRDLLTHLLRRKGFAASGASSGLEALRAIEEGDFDLVLLDVVMPDLDGFECLREIRRRRTAASLPVIMVTAEVERDRIVAAFRDGANDYVTKPIDPEITLARISTHLQLRQAQLALRESEERYALAAQGSKDGLWDWLVAQHKVYFSLRWKAMLGYADHEIGCSPHEWIERIHGDDRDRFLAVVDRPTSDARTNFECEIRMIHKDGYYRWMLCRGVYVRDGQGQVYRMAGSLTDITEGKVGDPLTGLPNRLLFVDRVERVIERTRRLQQGHFAVLFLDLDNFKLVNDRLGHPVGDKLLIAVAKKLESCLRSSDTLSACHRVNTLARHAGDEFTILLESLSSPDEAERVADRLLKAVAVPMTVEGSQVFVSLSVGIAVGDCRTGCAEDLLREADTAMYHAKSEGRNRHRRFDPVMQEKATRRLELEKDLRAALVKQEFLLHYQPIVQLRDDRIVSFETLVRWQHPDQGCVSPLGFISAAEEMGLIVPLGWWIFETACWQAALWQARHSPEHSPSVSVNFAVRQFYQPGFLDRIDQIVTLTGVNPRKLTVEVTESILMDKPEVICPILSRLREMRMKIGVDDFGTGYSSLAYLHRLPLDMLKIDRSFVSTMLHSSESLEIVRTIIDLAGRLKLHVVAEGVEQPAQRAKLLELGCSHAQGFLYSPPVPVGRAVEMLEEGSLGEAVSLVAGSGAPVDLALPGPNLCEA